MYYVFQRICTTNATQVQASLNRGERYDDTHIDRFGRIRDLRNGVSVYGYVNTQLLTSETFAQFATPNICNYIGKRGIN
jgi:hypothetical protein